MYFQRNIFLFSKNFNLRYIFLLSYFPSYTHTIYYMNQGGSFLKEYIEQRALELANYIIENKATVRMAAKKFCVSKSTVHKDVTERLAKINPHLWATLRKVLDENKAQRHIRGGIATKNKYTKIREK